MARAVLLYLTCLIFLSVVPAGAAEKVVAGDWDFCSPANPCSNHQGDCDTDADCVAGLHCVKDVGPEYNLAKGVDVCIGTPTNQGSQNNQNQGTTGNNNNPDWAGGGVKPGTNTGSTGSTTNTSSTSGACANVFYAVSHPDECLGVSQNDTSTSSNTGTRTTGQGCGVTWVPGDFNYCRNCGPCDEGVGGCDPGLNHQCKGGLVCSSSGICVKP